MPLKLRPTGLGSGIDKDRPDYTVYTRRVGRRPHLPDPWRSRQFALVLVADRQWSDDALGPRGDPGRGQGAISEELGRLEGVGEAGRGCLSVALGAVRTEAGIPPALPRIEYGRLRHQPARRLGRASGLGGKYR